MIDDRALAELHKHYDEACQKHPPFTDTTALTDRLQDRLTKLVSAIGSTADKHCNAEIGRRLAQVAAIALRGIVNLAYPVAQPKTPQPCTPSPSQK